MTDRRNWLTHPVQAWRAFAERIDACTDAEAVAAGLTVEHLPNSTPTAPSSPLRLRRGRGRRRR